MEVKKCTKLKKQTRISCLIIKKADIEIYRPFFVLLKSKSVNFNLIIDITLERGLRRYVP